MRSLSLALVLLAHSLLTAQSSTPGQHPGDALALAEQAYAERQGPQAQLWQSRIKQNEPELEGSLDQFIRNRQGEQALRLVDAVSFFWVEFGELQKARQRFAQVLAMPSASAPTALRGKALYDAGLLAFRQGDQTASRSLNEESLAIGRGLNDKATSAAALIGLSRIALRNHDYATVRLDAAEALQLRQDLGDTNGEMSSVHMLAAAARMEDDSASASKYYELTLGIYGKNGDKAGVAGELFNLGFVHLHENDPDWAARLFKESVSMYRELRLQEGLAFNISGLAAVAAERHDAARAARLYGALDSATATLGIVLDPDDALDLERYSKLAREQLPETQFQALRSEGRRMSINEALTLGLQTK